MKHTYYGDTDFDGEVTFDDYARLDYGYGHSLTGWLNGDFDLDGSVTYDDYALIDLAYANQDGLIGDPGGDGNPRLWDIGGMDHFYLGWGGYAYYLLDVAHARGLNYTIEVFFATRRNPFGGHVPEPAGVCFAGACLIFARCRRVRSK